MNRSKLSIYKLCTAVILTMTAILGLVSFLALFEKDERYFKSSPIIIALYITVALAVLLGISAAFLSKKIGKIKIAPKDPYMLSLIPTATAVAVLAISIIEITKGNSGTHAILIAITLLGVAFYHLADVIKISPAIRLALGYVKILFCILIITKLHLEFKVELNSPLKLLTQFSAATAILSTLTDLRILLDRISTGYFVLAKICFLTVSLLGAIGALTEVASHPQKYTLDLLIYPILFLAIAIPTAVSFFTVKEDRGSDPAPQEEKTE